MKIRKATIKDVNEIFNLEKEWLKEGISWGLVPPKKKEIRDEIKKIIWYIADENNKIIGFIQGEIVKSDGIRPAFNIKKGQHYGELHQIYISKKFRGENVGTLLINKLLDHFKKEKLKIVKLKAQSKNLQSLINYYKKFGFKERLADMIMELK